MADTGTRLFVGGILSGALLALYGYVLVLAILYAIDARKTEPTAGAYWILHAIGGLVSALVAAQLAVAGGTGKASNLFVLGNVPAEGGAATLALIYLGVWLILGLAAVVCGLVQYKREVPPLADFAKAWIGLALAAAYAYFGVRP
jgi:hypothetical protein